VAKIIIYYQRIQ